MKDERRNEPIAIVGIGCRFPGGANCADAFWNNLVQGKDAICDVPPKRWDNRKYFDKNQQKKGKMYAAQGGFLEESIEDFDPHFFGISPREAEGIDPQQRLLLETSYEAMEDAGLTMEQVNGSSTGVFIGGFTLDNMILRLSPANEQFLDAHSAAQSTMCILSNRISHVFDLHGPSLTLDTACSSSATTTHYAVQSLRNGECDVALSGGVNIMLHPRYSVILSKGQFLSEHCRCKAFDTDAQGYVRAEGAGIVVLKPLSAAIQDNDRVYSIIMETGVNQDGKTPGISSPNPIAQVNLIKSVYKKAGITGADLCYIEAHGTGTKAGDKAELFALNEVLKETRSTAKRCMVGSVKTHIGHMEAGAGIAGIIKTALTLYHSKIPPNLHFNNPSEEIPFNDICIDVPRYVINLPQNKENIAGVNSFGYGGTNVHILMKSISPSPGCSAAISAGQNSWNIFPLSGKHQSAVISYASKYHDFIDKNSVSPEEIFYTVTQRRTHHSIRSAILYSSPQDLLHKLRSFHTASSNSDEVIMPGKDHAKELVFAFNGMGAQWAGMGIGLMEHNAVFSESMQASDKIFEQFSSLSILSEMRKEQDVSLIDVSYIAQPATFILQAALCDMWKSFGVKPSAVMGHSLGEIAAAYAAGILTKEDCLKIVYYRSKLQRRFEKIGGGMIAVGVSASQAGDLVKEFPGVVIAADNSNSSVTLSGSLKSLKKIESICSLKNIFCKILPVEIAYHSPSLDSIEDEVKTALASILPRKSSVIFYSSVTGTALDGENLDAQYWWRNIRQTVQFKSIAAVIFRELDCNILEIGPHPVLRFMLRENATEMNVNSKLFSSLYRKKEQYYQVLKTLGELYVSGYNICWSAFNKSHKQLTSLPGYPWQHEHCWKESIASLTGRRGVDDYTYYQQCLNLPDPTWQVELNDGYFPFLQDHRISGNIVVPGAMYVDIGISLHKKILNCQVPVLEDISFKKMCIVPADVNILMQVSYNYDNKKYRVHAKDRYDENAGWMLHAEGTIYDETNQEHAVDINLDSLKKRCPLKVEVDYFYDQLSRLGLEYGASFQLIDQVYIGDDEILSHINFNIQHNSNDFFLHPAIVDAAIHSFLADDGAVFLHRLLPVGIKKFEFYHVPVGNCWSFAHITDRKDNSLTGNFIIFDENGLVCARCTGLICAVSTEYNINAVDSFYRWTWKEEALPVTGPCADQKLLIIYNKTDIADEVISGLKSRFDHVETYFFNPFEDGDIYKTAEELFAPYNNSDKLLIVNLCSIFQGTDQGISVNRISKHCMTLTGMIKAIHNIKLHCSISIVSLTANAFVIEDTATAQSLETTILPGLGHVIQNEHNNISCKTIDISRDEYVDFNTVIDEIITETNDIEVVLRNNKRYIRTLIQSSVKENFYKKTVNTKQKTFEAAIYNDGVIDYYRFFTENPSSPAKHELLVQAENGLLLKNRSHGDSAKEYGLLQQLQTVYTGTVSKVGEDVSEYQAGDEVLFLQALKGIKTSVIIPDFSVIKKPPFISFDEAPFTYEFIKAYYALIIKAGIQAGSTILINNVSTLFSSYVIAVAKWKKAEVIAICSSEVEQRHLHSLNVTCLFSKKNIFDNKIDTHIDFAIGDADLIKLLPGDSTFINTGNVPGILFKELEKREISLLQANYDKLLLFSNKYAKEVALKALDHFHLVNKNIPYLSLGGNKLHNAIKIAADGSFFGSVQIKLNDEKDEVIEKKRAWFSNKGSYVITGGHSGFGLKMARWLADKGAEKIILISRSGVRDFASEIGIQSIKNSGTEVVSLSLDVTDQRAVSGALKEHDRPGSPIQAIFHCAMILNDSLIINLDEEAYTRVLNPKINGAWNLHSATLEMDNSKPLLVLISSISTILGNIGQGNYVAANAFLDQFALYRQMKNMPCTVVNLGLISDTGIVANNKHVKSLIENSGVNGMKSMEILARLDRILGTGLVQAGIFSIDWKKWFIKNHTSRNETWCRSFYEKWKSDDTGNTNSEGFLTEIKGLPFDIKKNKIESLLLKQFAETLHCSIDSLQVSDSIYNMGMDSLMTVEFVDQLQHVYGIKLTFNELISGENIERLTEKILVKIDG